MIRVVLIITVFTLLWAEQNYPWTLEPIYETDANYINPVNLEGDKTDEIIVCTGPYAYLNNQWGGIIAQFNFSTEAIFPIGAYDLNNIPFKEMVFCVHYADTVTLLIITEQGEKQQYKAYIGKDINKAGRPGYDGYMHNATAVDLDNDGYRELVCPVLCGFDLFPRGILVYDFQENRELWHYWVGGSPDDEPPKTIDIDGDGRKEIIFTTLATSNGGNYNGIDDAHSWIVVLSSRGRLVWQKKIGEATTVIKFWCGELYENGLPIIVVCETRGLSKREEPNRLLILNAQTGETIKYIATGERFCGMVVCDYNRDKKSEIMTGNSDGVMRIFSLDLDLIKQCSFNKKITVRSVDDLDGNGINEIVLTSSDGRFIILDEKFKELCNYPIGSGWVKTYPLKNGIQTNFLIRKWVPPKNHYVIYEINRHHLLVKNVPIVNILIILFVLMCVILIYLLRTQALYKKRVRELINLSPFAFFLFNHKGKLLYYNLKALEWIGKKNFSFFLHSPEIEKCIKGRDNCRDINITIKIGGQTKFFKGKYIKSPKRQMLIIIDKTQENLIGAVISWASIAQRLAHEIKNPLSTINLTLQRMQQIYRDKFGKQAGLLDGYTESVLEEVERLRRTTDKFMKILSMKKPEFIDNDIEEIIDSVLQRYRKNLPSGIKVRCDFSKDIPLIRCDRVQLSAAFSNIIENAIEAMGSKGTLTIRAVLVERIMDKAVKRYLEVRFEDTGKGMSSQEVANLFKPFESHKAGGTGLGLVITRTIIEQHQGEIKVESEEGIGTVVTILLSIQ